MQHSSPKSTCSCISTNNFTVLSLVMFCASLVSALSFVFLVSFVSFVSLLSSVSWAFEGYRMCTPIRGSDGLAGLLGLAGQYGQQGQHVEGDEGPRVGDHWLVTRDGYATLVTTSPAATVAVADMQARYHGAIVCPLTRVQWLEYQELTNFRSCALLAQPGRSGGDCNASRANRMSAHDDAHSLRCLPADLGASCARWSPA